MTIGGRPLIPAGGTAADENNFDALRLTMAAMVVYSHAFALYYGTERGETLSLLTAGFYNSGNIGVWVFFIISGFLITRSLERSASLKSYMAKRIRRIYPGYLVATSICAFAVTPLFVTDPHFTLGWGEALKTLGANLLLSNHFPIDSLFTHNPVGAINGSLWSIKFEFLCYIGIAALGIAGLLRKRHAILALYIVILAIWCWLDATGRQPGGGRFVLDVIGWPYRWFWVLPNFLIGSIIYLYRDVLPRSTALLTSGIVACFLAFWIPGYPLASMMAAHVLVPPVLAYATFWLAFHPRIALHRAASFGDFSYGTYLYAYVIQQMLLARLTLDFWLFVPLSLACSLLAGIASWFLVERHFLVRKPDSSPGGAAAKS